MPERWRRRVEATSFGKSVGFERMGLSLWGRMIMGVVVKASLSAWGQKVRVDLPPQ